MQDQETSLFRFFLIYHDCQRVSLSGTFNHWILQDMTSQKGLWYLEVPLALYVDHEFKFVVDGSRWITVPHYPLAENGNHYLQLPGKEVTFQLKGYPKASIAGSFSNWQPIEMVDQQGTLSHTMFLPQKRHFFRFVVQGVWLSSPHYKVDEEDNENNFVDVEVIE